MTIREAIQTGELQLAAAGIDSPRLDTELLLAHLLDTPRLHLWLRDLEDLSTNQAAKFRLWLNRRANREPLQHIIGSAAFLGLELHVNRDVLVPRPETEGLAQLANRFLAQRPSPAWALDWGTGSGCLALALAQAAPTARVVAIDVSPDALRVARANATAYRLADRIEFRLGASFAALIQPAAAEAKRATFDLIVANPPYIPSGEIAELAPEVRDHDPRVALDGGTDGLDCFRQLAREGKAWLKPDGVLMAEFGDGQSTELRRVFDSLGWNAVSVEKDLSDRERVLIVAPRQF